jgi:hypothetical protein
MSVCLRVVSQALFPTMPLTGNECTIEVFVGSGVMKTNHRHAEITDEGTSGIPFGASFDAIEYGRGQLAALAYLSTTAAREVHVLRLRSSFARAGMVHKLRFSLRVLNLMREAQELGGGYWFPTSLRVVPIDGQAILVGPVPTHELQRHFSGVTRAGYARIIPQWNGTDLPSQDLDDWLGLDTQDTVAWSELQIANAQASMGPTISSGTVQFFCVQTARSRLGNTRKLAWSADPRSSIVGKQGVVLCRVRVAPESFRYFFGRVEKGRMTAEGSDPKDVIRLQFGLAALAGEPCTVLVSSRESGAVIHLPPWIPRPERQLVFALCTRDFSFPGKAYRVRSETFTQLIVSRLKRLGCEVRLTNG